MAPDPLVTGPPRRKHRAGVVVGALALGVLVALVLGMIAQNRPTTAGGTADEAAPSLGPYTSAPSSAGDRGAEATSQPSASATPDPPTVADGAPPRKPDGGPPLPPRSAFPVPVEGVVPLGETAKAGDGITLSVRSVEAIDADGGGGIGDLAGPAIAVTIRVKNNTGDAIPLNEVVVTTTYGPEVIPAPAVANDSRNNRLTGELRAGQTARGTYVFNLAESARDNVAILVSYAGGAPNVAFTGRVN